MKITKSLSDKATELSALSMLLIVMMHSYIPTTKEGIMDVVNIVNYDIVTRVAVPLFFLISGFFMGKSLEKYEYRELILKKVRTLLFPYLIWLLLTFLFYGVATKIPVLTPFFNGHKVAEYSFAEYLNYIFIYPINTPLWFIRDLFVICLFAKLLNRLILSPISLFYFIIVFSLWIFGIGWKTFTFEPLLFFSIGLLYYNHYDKISLLIIIKSHKKRISFITTTMLLVTLSTVVLAFFYGNELLNICRKICILFMLYLFYILFKYNYVNERICFYLQKFKHYSFFVYCAHIVPLQIIKKLLLYIGPPNDYWYLLSFLMTFLLTIYSLILLQKFLIKISPRTFYLITGNRC